MGILEIIRGQEPFWKRKSQSQRGKTLEQNLESAINTAYPFNWQRTPPSLYPANGEIPDNFSAETEPYASPRLIEFSTTQSGGANPAFVLSDTPRQGFKWIIDNLSFYDTGNGIGALAVFLLAPGYDFTPSVNPFGSNVPGTIKLGIGRVFSGGTPTVDFTQLTSSLWEGSVQDWMPGYALENNWRIGVSEMVVTGLTRTIALRLLYREVPSGGQVNKPPVPKVRTLWLPTKAQ